MEQVPGQIDQCIEISLNGLLEDGWDIADKYAVGARDNALVPDEDDAAQ